MARCFPSKCQPKKFLNVRLELSFCEGMVVSYVDETGKEFRGALISHEARTRALTSEVKNDNKSTTDHDHCYSKSSILHDKCDYPLASRRNKNSTTTTSSKPNYYMNSGIQSREVKSVPPHPMENASHCFVSVCKAPPDQVLPYVPSHTRRAKLNALRVIEMSHRKGHPKKKQVMLNHKWLKKPCHSKIQTVKMKPFSINIPKVSIGPERPDFTQEIPTNVSLNSESEVKTINSMMEDPAQLTEVMDSNTSTYGTTKMESQTLFTDRQDESQETDMQHSCSSEVAKTSEEQEDMTAQTEEMELVHSSIETPILGNKEPVAEGPPSTIETGRTNEEDLNDLTLQNILETPAGLAGTSTIDDDRSPEVIQQMSHLITDIRNESSPNPFCDDGELKNHFEF